MASRINLNLIIVLIVVLVGSAGLIGGFFYLQIRGDAERLERQGDEFLASGEIESAKSAYMRAARREPGTERYTQKAEDALRRIVPETAGQARERFGELLAVLRYRVNHRPTVAEYHERLIDELLIAATRTQAAVLWNDVEAAAIDMWSNLSPSDPERPRAKLYEAMALLQPSMIGTRTEEQLERGREAIEAFLEAEPESDEGWAVIVNHHGALAAKAYNEGLASAGDELDRAWAVADEARETVDGGVWTPIAVIDLAAFERSVRDESSISEDELTDLVQTLAERLVEIDDAALVSSGADAIQRITWIEDRPDPLLIVDRYLEDHPDAPTLRFVRARYLYRLRKLDEASDDAEAILNAEPLPVSYEAQVLFSLRRQAAGLLCDVAFLRWAEAEEGERAQRLQALYERRDELEAMVADEENNPLLLLANAKVAMAEDNSVEAVRAFERLLTQGIGADVETLVYASAMLEEEGSLGPALERIEQAVASQPSNVPLLLRKIELEMRMNDYDAAMETATRALRFSPDDERLLAAYQTLEQRIARADGVMVDPVTAVIQEAHAAVNREEFERARGIVLDGIEEHGENARLVHTMAVIERLAGRDEEVRRWVDRGLELYPDSRVFQGMDIGLRSGDDRVRQIELSVEQQYPGDSAEKFARLFVEFDLLAEMQDRLIEQYEEGGDSASADEARAVRDRAEAKAQEYLEKARNADPENPMLLNQLFTRALQAGRETGDWSEAERLANRAANANTDGAGGKLFLGRLAWSRGDQENALSLLRQVTQEVPHEASAWRALALAELGVGNVRSALENFEEAYRRNPMDLTTVRPYVDVLLRTGEQTRALLILQKARRASGTDVRLRETWLTLEGQIGDKAEVLKQRRQLWQIDPTDRLNAARLVQFLSETDPDRTTILDEEGRVQHSPATWDRLTQREQQRLIQRTESEWEQEAHRILEEMAEPAERNVSWHALKADVLRESGDLAGGEAVLREYMQRQSEPEDRLMAGVALGQYLARAQRFSDAVSVLESVQADQRPDRREADLTLGNLFFQLSEYGRAADLFADVYAANPSRSLGIRLVESHMNAGDIDAAREAFDRIRSDGWLEEENSESRLVEAALLDAEADRLWAAGNAEAGDERLARFHELIDEVITLDPSNPTPYILRARTLVKEYRRAGDPVLLDDALFALTRADEVRGDQAETSMVRVAVYQAQNAVGRAINELKRVVDRSPEIMRARITLVQLLVQQGLYEDAVSTITDAIERSPGSALWLNYRGSLYLDQMDQPSMAVADFSQSFQLEPTASNLARLLSAMMQVSPPEHRRVAQLLRENRDLIEEHPQLRALAAEAMARSGDRAGAIEELRQSYQQLERMVEEDSISTSRVQAWFDSVARVYGPDEAEQANGLVRELIGGEPNVQENRAMARMWAIADRYEEAAALQREAIARVSDGSPLLAILRRELAGYCIRLEDWSCAAEAYEAALEQAPNDVAMRNNLAYLLAERLNDARRALPHAERAAELAPNDANIIDTYGRVLFLRGDLKEAERQLRRSTQLQELPNAYLHLAEVFLAQDDVRRAQRALERAQELNPDPRTQAEIVRVADDIRVRSGR